MARQHAYVSEQRGIKLHTKLNWFSVGWFEACFVGIVVGKNRFRVYFISNSPDVREGEKIDVFLCFLVYPETPSVFLALLGKKMSNDI